MHDLLHTLVVAVFRVGTDTNGKIAICQYPDRSIVEPYDEDCVDSRSGLIGAAI
jgi:hypothetical protein